MVTDRDPAKVRRVTRAFLQMKKFRHLGGLRRTKCKTNPSTAAKAEGQEFTISFKDGRESMKAGWTGTFDPLDDYSAKA
jgi:hypothetical protein